MPEVDVVPAPEEAPSNPKATTESKDKPNLSKGETESANAAEPKDSKQ